MNIPSRPAFIATALLQMTLAIAPQVAWAQTPAQMEYERQQREYWRQQEQQRQEQQRQQQLMNENARRQQEESSRINAPMGQSPAPGYQGATPQTARRQQGAQTDAAAATATAKWVERVSVDLAAFGGTNIYSDPVTMRRFGNVVRIWEMWDFKSAQVVDGKRFLSLKNQFEYDCKGARLRMLFTAGFSEHVGKGAVVGSGNVTPAWEPAAPGSYKEELWKVACGKK